MRATSEEVSCKIDDIRDSISFLEKNQVKEELKEISIILDSINNKAQSIEQKVDECEFHLNK